MAGKRGRRKTAEIVTNEEEQEQGPDFSDEKPSVDLVDSVSSSPESDVARLRKRWELASVLNFLHVFKPKIELKVDLSAEEIEQGLITPNNSLAQLHIALLKGIPPVSKTLSGSDAWVAILFKKLTPWWPWVAKGEIPLVVGQGEEVSRYKELDPVMRLLMLKALCEIRAFQDDIVHHISDTLKEGTDISTFRKDRMGGGGNGTSYWFDGDEILGYRLYKEITKGDFMPKLKGKGRLTQPTNSYQWETIATNLEEFQQLSVKLSSSKVVEEAAVAQKIEDDIIPMLQKVQMKKERALKRQQRQETLLDSVWNSYRTEGTRSCRNRKPVSYTFDEYDRSIDEGLQVLKKRKTTQEPKKEKKGVANGGMNGDDDASHDSSRQNNGDVNNDGGSSENDDDTDNDADHGKLKGAGGGTDSDDEDFDDNDNKNDDEDEDEDGDDASGESASSENENNNNRGMGRRVTRHSLKQKGRLSKHVTGLRRSRRLTSNDSDTDVEAKQHADTKKMLRQRPTRNSDYRPVTVSDSEDGNSSEKTSSEASGAEDSRDVLKGLLEETEEDNVESEKKDSESGNENDSKSEDKNTESGEENPESEEENAESEEENAESEEENSENAESEEENAESEEENSDA